jgi:hypothetical protein
VRDCADRLQGRTAGGGKKIESNIDNWKCLHSLNFVFVVPCIISLFYQITNVMQLLAVVFILLCKVTLHVSGAFCTHHQEYN